MNTRSYIKCACGQRVITKDVLTTGYLLHTAAQVFVFVKFRCPKCKKLGQEVVNRNRWDWAVLEEEPGEQSADETKKFEQMGVIKIDEVVDFHFELEKIPRFALEEEDVTGL